jgi:hypothetical protein
VGSRVSNGRVRKQLICGGDVPCDGPGCPPVPLRTSLVMMGSGVRVSPSRPRLVPPLGGGLGSQDTAPGCHESRRQTPNRRPNDQETVNGSMGSDGASGPGNPRCCWRLRPIALELFRSCRGLSRRRSRVRARRVVDLPAAGCGSCSHLSSVPFRFGDARKGARVLGPRRSAVPGANWSPASRRARRRNGRVRWYKGGACKNGIPACRI